MDMHEIKLKQQDIGDLSSTTIIKKNSLISIKKNNIN